MRLESNLASRFAILATGDEITAGEVINSNAAFLSQEITSLSGEVVLHLSVRDRQDDIEAAIQLAHEKADHVVITGGLGPTSDDRTRASVAHYCGKPLILNEQIWLGLQRLFESMGRPTSPGHMDQCKFPEGATLFKNSAGTADGFLMQTSLNKCIWVLPGPPRELQSVWVSGMKSTLQMKLPQRSEVLKTWTVLGKGESEVADFFEDVFAELPCRLGYRAKVPFVIGKVWFDSADEGSLSEAFAKIDEKFKDVIVPVRAQDQMEHLRRNLSGVRTPSSVVRFFDGSPSAAFAKRILEIVETGGTNLGDLKWVLETRTSTAKAGIEQILARAEDKKRVLESDPMGKQLIDFFGKHPELEDDQKFVAFYIAGDRHAILWNRLASNPYFFVMQALWNRKVSDVRLVSYFVESALIDLCL